MEPHVVEAICLRRADSGDFDAVVTFLTRDRGKVAAMARGVKRPRSAKAPACQVGCRSRLQLGRGARLPVVAQAVVEDSFHDLRGDLWKFAYAAYCCELTERALPDEVPHEAIYDLLLETLTGLSRCDDGAALVHSFELRLLAELGYEPVLDRCAGCGLPILEDTALFCPGAGGLIHVDERPEREAAIRLTPRAAQALRRLLDPAAYDLDLVHTSIPPTLAPMLRAATREHIRRHLEFEPRSAAFLEQLRTLEAG